MIKVSELNFSYEENVPVIKNVNFEIKKGSYTTIIGHNGSGKSTIAKLLIGLLEKASGSIEIGGFELTEENLTKIRSMVGVVFQNPDNQFIGSTVADDIAFGLENQQVPTNDMQEIIERYAQKVNMSEFLDKEPTKLSGGQKQRVAIAGVLAMDLDIIILDEATSMLDPQGKEEINALVDELHEKSNLTIISITHDMEEVLKSDHVVVLDAGEVKMSGSPKEILNRSEELIELQLDIPFIYKMQSELENVGIKIEKQLDIEGVVSELCQLNSKS
ncbi:energy-coupling factor transporter ATPase [Breznakia pachnodae]|uniref:Energy-coupling factor transport system ATP-binding protein n=1 Tax=Breznakia pachnodae TaxID=265178 RepID=A0ABU0DZG9_9FIRM|nr:energy-coupling factor transporter ATPase [Breznakia pachnodae]MDQ0360029.1 energy-coupling factor transport system ATP-binding protein [Breznakia pachnodae]